MLKWLVAGVCGALSVLALLVLFFEPLVLRAMAPAGPFDPAATPAAPDPGRPESWTAHPVLSDEAAATPPGLSATAASDARADVFYLHPTSYLGSSWNGPVDDPALNRNTDRLSTRIQASAFNGCCAVYGPRYRQANGTAFTHPSPDGDRAIDLAYHDVSSAFQQFLAETGSRPFFVVSHSQGSILAARLLADEIRDSPHRQRLVAAYVIGGPITATETGLPVCARPEQVGCVVGWNARGPRYEENVFDFRAEGERLCVNPLSWRHDDVAEAADRNQGAVFLHGGTPRPHFADARCRAGFLLVSEIGDPPRDVMSRILDWLMGPQNYHPIEYQLFWMNLRENAQLRLDAFLAAR